MNTKGYTLTCWLTKISLVIIFLTAGFTAHAANMWWDGPSGTWITAANWNTQADGLGTDPAAAPGASDTAYFNAATFNGGTGNGTLTAGLGTADIAAQGIVINNTGTTTFTPGNTVARTITLGSGGITMNTGAGAVTLGNTSTRTTLITLSASQAWANNSSSLFLQNYYLAVPASLSLGTYTLTLGGSGSGGYQINAPVTGTGALIINGSGTVTLTGTNTYSGTTTISAGTLTIGGAGQLGSGTYAGNIANDGAFSYASSAAQTLSGNITGVGSVLQNGAGNLTLSGTGNTFTGDVGFAAAGKGDVMVASLGNGSGNIKLLQNDALHTTATITTTKGVILGGASSTGQQIYSDSGVFTVNGVISDVTPVTGAAQVNLRGAGSIVLGNAANTYGEKTLLMTTVSVSSIKNASVNSSLGTNGNILIGLTTTAGNLTYTGTGDTSDRAIDLAGTTGGATIDQSGSGLLKFNSAFTANGAGAKTLTLQGSTAGAGELAGAVVDNGGANTTSLTKAGTGTWTLSGASTYTGATAITGGTLKYGINSAINSVSTMTLNSAGSATLDLNGYNGTIASLTLGGAAGTASSSSTVQTGAGTLTLGGNVTTVATGNPTTAPVISGKLDLGAATRTFTVADSTGSASDLNLTADVSGTSAGLLFNNAGKVTVSGNNSFTGDFGFSGSGKGDIIVSSANGMGANSGSILLYQADTLHTTVNITTGKNVLFNGGNHVNQDFFVDPATTLTINGALGDANAVTTATWRKQGNGTLVLNGANTFNEAVNVNAGTLLLNGTNSGSGLITVNSTLGGSGTIGGSVTFNTGALALFTNGSHLVISGNLTNNNNVVQLNLSNNVPAGTYTLATYGGSLAGAFNSTPTILTGSITPGATATVNTSGGSVNLVVSKATPSIVTNPVPASITYGQGIASASLAGGYMTNAAGAAVAGSFAFTDPTLVPNHAGSTNVLITFTPTDTANYNNVTNTVNVAVNQASLGITANNTNKFYDGVPFTGGNGVAYYGFVLGDTAAVLGGVLSYGGTSQNATNVGGYTIAPSGLTSANYTITYTNGTLTITQSGTTIAVNTSSPTSGFKDSVTFAATLPASESGSVTFKTNGVTLSVNSFSGNTATSAATILLPRGTNTVTAEFAGGLNYHGSTNSLAQVVTNHPPVANAGSYSRSTASWHIMVSELLTNATDNIDGDTLTLVSVGVSTNGVTLYNDGTLVGYMNTNLVNDQFTYTVTDGFGGTNGGVITLTFSNAVSGTSSISGVITGNPTTLTAYGIAGYTYITERATNLTQVPWEAIATNMLTGTNVVISVTDSNPPAGEAYYRLKWQP